MKSLPLVAVVLVGVVLVGVVESQESIEAWLRRIRSADHHHGSLYFPRPPVQHSNTNADASLGNADTGTSSVSRDTEEEAASDLQDLQDVLDEGVGLRGDEDNGLRRTRRNDMGSYGNGGLNKREHIFSILSLLVFASFLAYLVYYLVTKEEEAGVQMRMLHPRDDEEVLAKLLRNVIVGIGKWSLMEYL
ncbi:uncharacterized protein [Panulirus ornatus]|uniref:uncharacterized protein n=1 Tax=Panulirus ornatus TaxID=150431 RepID=UPI003A8B18A8